LECTEEEGEGETGGKGDDSSSSLPESDDGFRLSGVGWRLEGSVAILPPFIAGDLNVDVIMNFHDQETGEWKGLLYAIQHADENVDLFISLGGQALGEGAAVSTGPVFLWDVPSNEDLEGGGWQIGGTAVAGEKGAELNLSLYETSDGLGKELYIGYGVGGEASIGGGWGYAWNVIDKVDEWQRHRDLPKPWEGAPWIIQEIIQDE
jgi:hypothetical protein